ncbi:MAG TPA: S8 family peptidase [Gemmatimonadaceae bacterium]|nr:S8 family peptidase [Gemmatimonadaceae bacterium]
MQLESLENRRLGIELLSVQRAPEEIEGTGPSQLATVFVPDNAVKHFVSRFEEYATQVTPKKGEPKHRELVDRISSLRRATLRALWTDDPSVYPRHDERIWWEVWLRRDEGQELVRFAEFAAAARVRVAEQRLAFDDRTVILAHASPDELAISLDVLQDLAELRAAKESSAPFINSPRVEQAEWIEDLQRRTIMPPRDAPAVCILDTGVNRGHPLLAPLIDAVDATAVDAAWGSHDDGGGPGCRGHGTSMAGLAAYGDLVSLLAGNHPVRVRNRLESVKILPPTGQNEPQLYGAVTAAAVAQPEITAPRRPRVFSLAVSACDQRDRGLPTSWSSALDALAAGRTFDAADGGLRYLGEEDRGTPRLFVVSGGNVLIHDSDHLARSDVECVHDPAQAWNVLTVGAFTDKALITDPAFHGWNPLARPGELSPWSTTSVPFVQGWPTKPELVCEGGNLATDGTNIDSGLPDLCLLSTSAELNQSLFTLVDGTSPGSAEVARMAANVNVEYPGFWPETVRALVVHSARWTASMQTQFGRANGRRAKVMMLRRYGYGVPSIDRALRSARDSLTLVFQGEIHPYAKGAMREMHMHSLPWPVDALRELGAAGAQVHMRVTLSYFVEPNPSRRGWRRRHRYASHGLRFKMNEPGESQEDFSKRLNKLALEEDEERPQPERETDHWLLGEEARTRGSIHSDVWQGPASDLADCGIIGIYPVSGWWKDQPKRDRSRLGARYGLVVSIETDAVDVDVWTPVANELHIPAIEVEVPW